MKWFKDKLWRSRSQTKFDGKHWITKCTCLGGLYELYSKALYHTRPPIVVPVERVVVDFKLIVRCKLKMRRVHYNFSRFIGLLQTKRKGICVVVRLSHTLLLDKYRCLLVLLVEKPLFISEFHPEYIGKISPEVKSWHVESFLGWVRTFLVFFLTGSFTPTHSFLHGFYIPVVTARVLFRNRATIYTLMCTYLHNPILDKIPTT